MNDSLVDVASRIRYIANRKIYKSQLPDMWALIEQELDALKGNKIFIHLFKFYCERFAVSGSSRSAAFDNMMNFAFDNRYIRFVDDTVLRDVMSVYIASKYEGDKPDCIGQDWPKSHLLNFIFEYLENTEEEREDNNQSGSRPGHTSKR